MITPGRALGTGERNIPQSLPAGGKSLKLPAPLCASVFWLSSFIVQAGGSFPGSENPGSGVSSHGLCQALCCLLGGQYHAR